MRRNRVLRRAVAAFVAGLLAGTIAVLGAAPAAAHDTLVGTDPEDRATLASGPPQVVLTFTQPPQSAEVAVTGPDGGAWEAEPAQVVGSEVSVPLRPLGPAGTYTTGYRVVSSDGHPVTGSTTFVLTRPGTGTPDPVGPVSSAEQPATTGGGGAPVWPWFAAAGVLVVAGFGVARRFSR